MLNLDELSIQELQQLEDNVEEFLFKQPLTGNEPFAESYRKNPQQFRKLIRALVAYKRDLLRLFKKMYEDRWRLVNYHTIPTGQVRMDEGDEEDDSDYFYTDAWDEYDQQLAQIIEDNNKKHYELGLLALALALRLAMNISSADVQQEILDHALKVSDQINNVTRKRIRKQIEAALALGEDREAFEKRLKQVLINLYRGRFIAENEGLQSYLDAKKDMALGYDYKFKTWIGVQQSGNEVCGEIIGETVPVGELFSNGEDEPLAHIGCRCDLIYSNSSAGSD